MFCKANSLGLEMIATDGIQPTRNTNPEFPRNLITYLNDQMVVSRGIRGCVLLTNVGRAIEDGIEFHTMHSEPGIVFSSEKLPIRYIERVIQHEDLLLFIQHEYKRRNIKELRRMTEAHLL